jgi:hypothetical protein
MIRLNFTVEGFSEERFVTDILRPHLLQLNIYADVRKILTNRKHRKRGGIVSYVKFKNDIVQWFRECPDVYHTSFLDLYGLKPDFPGFEQTKTLNPYERIAAIERMIMDDLSFWRFIPYIQLHEYETLLFADTFIMEKWLSLYNRIPQNCFTSIRNSVVNNNPELINEYIETAPSKRILSICPNYDKVNDGILILKEIGLEKIRKECIHFNEWLTKIEKIGNK